MNYTPEQEQAIRCTAKRVCVDAGAGSGKTRVLVDRIIHLLETPAYWAEETPRLDRIVAITFTDKAAGEMKERLRGAFRKRAAQERDHPERMTYWRDLERRTEAARISTIHAFCTRVLKENALELGLDPDCAALTEAETMLLSEEVVTRVLHERLEARDEATLRLATEMSTTQLKGLLKTCLQKRGLLRRLAKQWPFEDAAALAQAWRAALEEEQDRALVALTARPKLRTFCYQLASFEGCCTDPEEGRESYRRLMLGALEEAAAATTPQDIRRVLSRILEKPKRGSKKAWPDEATYKKLEKVQREVKGFLEKYLQPPAPDPAIEAAAVRLSSDFIGLAGLVIEAYQAEKRQRISLDFDDMIYDVVEGLREKPALCVRLAESISFLLIDEFQDTDSIQLEIAQLLSDHETGPKLFIVGDAKQSIYYFRGAEVEVFQEERTRALKTISLDKNFRTLPDVMHFINDFFYQSKILAAVESYHPMAPFRDAQGDARIEFLMGAPLEEGERRSAEAFRREEAEAIAQRILAFSSDEKALLVEDEKGGLRGAQFGDVALLFRSTSAIYLYEDALRRAGIPYALASGKGFFHCQEIVDLCNLLTLAVDPWHEPALLGYLRGPLVGLSDESLALLAQQGPLARLFLDEAVPEDFVEKKLWNRGLALVRQLRDQVYRPLPQLMRWVLNESGLEAIMIHQHHGVQKAFNLRKLIALAEDFSRNQSPSLAAFVQYLSELTVQEIREGEASLASTAGGAVSLLTVHASKGLEFPIVFLPDMASRTQGGQKEALFMHRHLGLALKITGEDGEKKSPAIGSAIAQRIETEEEAESARLLYVAMTRARDYLVLCGKDKAPANSLFAALAGVYGLDEAPHGAMRNSGAYPPAWQARVVRRASGQAPRLSETSAPERVSVDLIQQRLDTPDLKALRKSYSISAVLDHLAGGLDPEEEKQGEESGRRISPNAAAAMLRGTLVHRLFELWNFISDPPPSATLLRGFGLGPAYREKLAQELDLIARDFQESDLAKRLAQEKALQREAPFFLVLGDALLTGTIDLLLEDGTVVDYKTGRYAPERHARYEWQLLLYAAAVRELRGVSPKEGMLYYVDERKCHRIAISDAEMDAALRDAALVIQEIRQS